MHNMLLKNNTRKRVVAMKFSQDFFWMEEVTSAQNHMELPRLSPASEDTPIP
jgi:hypothetical protein